MQVNSVFIMLIKLQNLAALYIKCKYKTLQGRQVDVSWCHSSLVRLPNATLTTSAVSNVGEIQQLPRRQY